MPQDIQQTLNAAVVRLLRPLVRLLLKHGMAYGTFAELSRKAFVDEGFEHVNRSGKRASVSSVSALTGLTRKETKRLREAQEAASTGSGERYNRAIRVISGWLNTPKYQDDAGDPAQLPMEGATSFTSLVKEFSGDIPPAAMLSVLQTSQTVRVSDAQVELLERAYIPRSTPLEKLHILGTDTAELIATIDHNLEVDYEDRVFQRKVSNHSVSATALDEFRRLSNRKSQQLLEEYHSWLADHQSSGEEEDPERYVAIGIYYSEYNGEEDQS